MDVRDIFFQAHPFAGLGSPIVPKYNLFLIEEISPYSSGVSDPDRAFINDNPRSRRLAWMGRGGGGGGYLFSCFPFKNFFTVAFVFC